MRCINVVSIVEEVVEKVVAAVIETGAIVAMEIVAFIDGVVVTTGVFTIFVGVLIVTDFVTALNIVLV